MSKRKPKVPDSEPESEELEDEEESSSDSEEDDEESSDDTSLEGDSEESDVDVDTPRVAQWVDEDDLEQPEMAFGDASHKKAEDAEDIVRVVCVCVRSLDILSIIFALHRKPYKKVRQSNDVCWGPP